MNIKRGGRRVGLLLSVPVIMFGVFIWFVEPENRVMNTLAFAVAALIAYSIPVAIAWAIAGFSGD